MRVGFAFYWMTNDDWFYFDDDDIGEPHLTAKATPEVISSFEVYKKMIEEDKKTSRYTEMIYPALKCRQECLI